MTSLENKSTLDNPPKYKKGIDFFIVFFGVTFITIGVLSGMLGGVINDKYDISGRILYKVNSVTFEDNTTFIDEIIIKCDNNNNIDKKLECVRSHISQFYIYKVRPDREIITFNTLFNEGGDCGNWASMWEHVGKAYDLDIKPIRILINSTLAHRFSVLSNSDGYCNVDQKSVNCVMYG